MSSSLISATLAAILQSHRLDVLLACDANVVSYDPDAYLPVVFRIYGRNSKLIVKPILLFILWAIAWGSVFEIVPALRDYVSDAELVSPLLTPVSFLLVFRLGRAAVRYWDARAAAGKMVETCRTIASTGIVSCADDPVLQTDIARWLCMMPVAVKRFLRPVAVQRQASERDEVGGLLSDHEASRVFDDSGYPPLAVLTSLRALALRAGAQDDGGRVASGLAQAGRAQLYKQLNEQIDTLTGAWGAMERINGTPLPFAYVAHLRTFLLLYLLLWAIEALAKHSWASVPVLLLASFALLGIEAAAVECERPFKGATNHLALGKMGVVVARNVAQTLRLATDAPMASTAGGSAGGTSTTTTDGERAARTSSTADVARVRPEPRSARTGTSTAELMSVASAPLE